MATITVTVPLDASASLFRSLRTFENNAEGGKAAKIKVGTQTYTVAKGDSPTIEFSYGGQTYTSMDGLGSTPLTAVNKLIADLKSAQTKAVADAVKEALTYSGKTYANAAALATAAKAEVDITSDNAAAIAAAVAPKDAQIATLTAANTTLTTDLATANATIATRDATIAAFDVTSNDATVIAAAVAPKDAEIATLTTDLATANTTIATRDATITTLNAQINTLQNPAGTSVGLTTAATDVLVGVSGGNDTFTGTSATDDATDIVVDASTTDSDTLTLTLTAVPVALTTINVETINLNSTIVSGTSLDWDASNVRGADTINITRSNVGSINGTGASQISNITGGQVDTVNVVSGVTALVVEQQTLDGTIVNATGVTGAVTLHGAGTINAASSTGTVTLSDVDLAAAALGSTGLDGVSTITANSAATVNVGQGAGVLTGAVTANAAAATTIAITTTGAVTLNYGSAATAAVTVSVTDIDASGATITSGLTPTSTITNTLNLEGTTASTDVATISAIGAVALDTSVGTAQDVDTLNLSGNGAAATYTTVTGNDFSTINLTGSQSVTLVVDMDDIDGETVTDSTTSGTTTLRIDAVPATAATIDLSNVAVDVIDIDVANYAIAAGTAITLADNTTVLVGEDQGTDDLTLTAGAEDYTLTINAGDDTADTSLSTITLGAALLTDFDVVTINATNGAFSATSVNLSQTTGTGTLTITGNKAVTLGDVLDASELTSIDAGSLTGVLTLEVQEAELTSLTSGTAADVIELNSGTAQITVNAGDGANDIDIDAVAAGTSITTGAGADSVEIVDADSIVISTGDGNDTVAITGTIDTDAIIDAGGGTGDTLDINSAGAIVLENNANFSIVNFETIDIVGANGQITISDEQFTNNRAFALTGDSATADILRILGDSTADTINAADVEITTAKLIIEGGDGADTLTGADDDATSFVIGDNEVDSGEVITGGSGTDILDGSALTAAIDLSVATLSNLDTLYNNLQATTLGQGSGITAIADGSATALATKSGLLTLLKSTTSFEASAELTAGAVDIAGEWFITTDDNGDNTLGDNSLTYYDEVTGVVTEITLTGAAATNLASALVVAGSLVISIA